jgi:hypothetical protein
VGIVSHDRAKVAARARGKEGESCDPVPHPKCPETPQKDDFWCGHQHMADVTAHAVVVSGQLR